MLITITNNISTLGGVSISIPKKTYKEMGCPVDLVFEGGESPFIRYSLLDDSYTKRVVKKRDRYQVYFNGIKSPPATGKYKLDNSNDPEVFNLLKK